MNRTKDFDALLSQELKSPDFAKAYFLSIMQELDGEPGLSLLDALKHIIRKMGVKDYAELVDMKRQNISRFLAQNTYPKLETLNHMLSPFDLKAKISLEQEESAA